MVSDAPDAVRVQSAENAIVILAMTRLASAKNVRIAINAAYARTAGVTRALKVSHSARARNAANAISARYAVVANVAKSQETDPETSVPAKNVKTPTAISVMFAATVTIATHPDVPERYVKIKTVESVPEQVVKRERVSARDPHVMQTYVLSARNVHDAVSAGAVKNLMTQMIRVDPHVPE